MSKFKVEFILKQHTPIIHFQSDHAGATLRVTELKPKLDRFLLALKNQNLKPSKSPQGEKFLNYKMKINCLEKVSEPIERQASKNNEPLISKGQPKMSSIPMFFANMGDDWKKNPKQLVWSKTNEIIIEIISFETKLIELILEYFEEFIFTTNFGMRQSKGFGSFEVISSTSSDFQKATSFIHFKNVKYKFTINLKDSAFQNIKAPSVVDSTDIFKKYGKLFEILNIFSKTYRSGINQNGYYFKSLMYKYATDVMKCTWDKKYLKSNFLGNKHSEITKQRKDHNNLQILNYDDMPKEYLLRDLLGLSTSQQWLKYHMDVEHKKDNNIKRYKSPITFKIINNGNNLFDIYLIVEPIKILNKSFDITCKSSATNTKEITINTPEKFDINEYLNFCFATEKIDDYPIKKDNDNKIINHLNDNNHKVIAKIYSELKQQTKKVD